MKKKSNLIDTKDELIKNFSKEQLDIYNYYKSKFSYTDKELYPVVKKDRELAFLENSYKILTNILKAEIVIALIIFTAIFIFTGSSKPDVQYEKVSIKKVISSTELMK